MCTRRLSLMLTPIHYSCLSWVQMLLFHLLEDMERLVGVFCRDTMQTCCSLKFAICLAGVSEQPKFISVAQCLKTPFGFEPEAREQATSMTRPSQGKKCAVKVGRRPSWILLQSSALLIWLGWTMLQCHRCRPAQQFLQTIPSGLNPSTIVVW